MACNNYALNGLAKTCDVSKGGVSEVYFVDYDQVSAVTLGTVSGNTMITGITMVTGTSKFVRYYVRKNTAYFTSTLNVTEEGGNYVSTELFIQFSRMEAKKHMEIRALSLNDLAVIVKDANGLYWYLGKDDAVTANAGEGATGTNREDSNHYSLTFTDESADFPYEIDPTIISGITTVPLT